MERTDIVSSASLLFSKFLIREATFVRPTSCSLYVCTLRNVLLNNGEVYIVSLYNFKALYIFFCFTLIATADATLKFDFQIPFIWRNDVHPQHHRTAASSKRAIRLRHPARARNTRSLRWMRSDNMPGLFYNSASFGSSIVGRICRQQFIGWRKKYSALTRSKTRRRIYWCIGGDCIHT